MWSSKPNLGPGSSNPSLRPFGSRSGWQGGGSANPRRSSSQVKTGGAKAAVKPVTIRGWLLRILLVNLLVSLLAIPTLTGGNFELPKSTWRATSAFVAEELQRGWNVSALPGTPGVFLAQQEGDFACALVLQDVCYAFNRDGGEDSHVGVWFSPHPQRNLSTIDVSADVCLLHKARVREPERDFFSTNDRSDLPVLFGQERRFGRLVHARAALKYRFAGRSQQGGVGTDGRLSTIDVEYLDLHPQIDVGLVSPRDGHLGHFVECAGGLMEVGKHLTHLPPETGGGGGGAAGGEGGGKGQAGALGEVGEESKSNLTVFFPRSLEIGEWPMGVASLIAGRGAKFLAGKKQGRQICFRNAIFPLNIRYTGASADLLRDRAAGAASELQLARSGRAGLQGSGKSEGEHRAEGGGRNSSESTAQAGGEDRAGAGKGEGQELVDGGKESVQEHAEVAEASRREAGGARKELHAEAGKGEGEVEGHEPESAAGGRTAGLTSVNRGPGSGLQSNAGGHEADVGGSDAAGRASQSNGKSTPGHERTPPGSQKSAPGHKRMAREGTGGGGGEMAGGVRRLVAHVGRVLLWWHATWHAGSAAAASRRDLLAVPGGTNNKSDPFVLAKAPPLREDRTKEMEKEGGKGKGGVGGGKKEVQEGERKAKQRLEEKERAKETERGATKKDVGLRPGSVHTVGTSKEETHAPARRAKEEDKKEEKDPAKGQVAAKSASKQKPILKTTPVPDLKPKTKKLLKPTLEPKAEAELKPKSEPHPKPKAKEKPKAEEELKLEQIGESMVRPKMEPEPELEPIQKQKPSPKLESKKEPEPKPKVEQSSNLKPGLKSELKTEQSTKSLQKPRLKPGQKLEPEPKSTPKPVPKPTLESEPKPKSKPKPKPQPKVDWEPKVEPRPKPKPKVEPKKQRPTKSLRPKPLNPNRLKLDKADADRWQVTLVRREHSRVVSNLDEVQAMLRRDFPTLRLEIAEFKGMPVLEQVEVMQRTLFYVTMHGASMSNVIFMRRGTVVLEFFPFKFVYGSYKRLALRSGIKYLAWHNTNRSLTSYTDNCLDKEHYAAWTPSKCHRSPDCRSCVRDRVITRVDLREVEALSRQAARHIQEMFEDGSS